MPWIEALVEMGLRRSFHWSHLIREKARALALEIQPPTSIKTGWKT